MKPTHLEIDNPLKAVANCLYCSVANWDDKQDRHCACCKHETDCFNKIQEKYYDECIREIPLGSQKIIYIGLIYGLPYVQKIC